MIDVDVTGITLDPREAPSHERITHLLGRGWQLTREQTIRSIERGTHRFWVTDPTTGHRSEVAVVEREGSPAHLRARREGEWNDSLLALPGDAGPATEGHEGRNILIIEDDATTADLFQRTLRLQGYGARVAPDAESGLIEVGRQAPDAIVLDLHLPLVDGLELLRRLRKSLAHAHTPVVIVTGDYLLKDSVTREIQALGAEIRFKPLWVDDLLQLAHDLLDHPRTA